MTTLVLYLLVFLGVGIFFVFIHLMMGRLIRPAKPDPEKLTIYECGEPTIGSSWIQFDLRFYVVALLFVIFDVEVVFFFPWAVVFGKANTLAATRTVANPAEYNQVIRDLGGNAENLPARYLTDQPPTAEEIAQNRSAGSSLAWLAFWDILVFFGVLLVGFAYLWKRGDLDWVRSMEAETSALPPAQAAAASASARELVGAGEVL
jgi:NADH-quinone oxidoreductase subunit A